MWNFLKIENNLTGALVSKTKGFGSNNYFQNSFKAQSRKHSKCLWILLYCEVLLLLNAFSKKMDQKLTYAHQEKKCISPFLKTHCGRFITNVQNFMLRLVDNV